MTVRFQERGPQYAEGEDVSEVEINGTIPLGPNYIRLKMLTKLLKARQQEKGQMYAKYCSLTPQIKQQRNCF